MPSPCAHMWELVGYEQDYFNAGSSVEVDDYHVLRCNNCGASKRVKDYELYAMQRNGQVRG